MRGCSPDRHPSAAVAPNDGGPTRQVRCTHYSSCLDLALDRKWPGFSCRGCGAFEREALDQAGQQEDADRCRALLQAVFRNRVTAKHVRRIVEHYAAARDQEVIT